MAKFVLTAQLQLQAPTNTTAVINDIRRQLQGIVVPVQIKGAAAAAQQVDQVTESTRRASSAAEAMGRSFGIAIKRFAAFTIASRAVSLFTNSLANAINEAIDFQREVVRVAQVTGKSVKDLRGLTDTITRLSTTLGTSSKELLSTATVLAQAGIEAKDLNVALDALAKTTLAPNFDSITETAEGAVAILAQFGLGVGALERQLSSVNAVAGAFAVEAEDLIGAVRRFGGVFKASGGSLEELLAIFTSVRATTRESAESISTGLRTIFTRIQRPKTIQFLKQFGIELTDLNGKFVGPFEAARRLSEVLSQLEQGDLTFIRVAEELGGFRQIGKVIPLLQQFALAQEALNVAQEGSDSLAKDAATAQQALAVQITKVKEEFLALVRNIAESDSFQLFARTALELASALIKVGEAIKPLIPLIGTLAAFRFAKGLGTFASSAGAAVRGLGTLGQAQTRNRGGEILAFARGGFVPGTGNRDTVPAMLTPGEFVIRKSSVNKIGADKLAAMNENRYATGGLIVQKLPNEFAGLYARPDKPDKSAGGKPVAIPPRQGRDPENVLAIIGAPASYYVNNAQEKTFTDQARKILTGGIQGLVRKISTDQRKGDKVSDGILTDIGVDDIAGKIFEGVVRTSIGLTESVGGPRQGFDIPKGQNPQTLTKLGSIFSSNPLSDIYYDAKLTENSEARKTLLNKALNQKIQTQDILVAEFKNKNFSTNQILKSTITTANKTIAQVRKQDLEKASKEIQKRATEFGFDPDTLSVINQRLNSDIRKLDAYTQQKAKPVQTGTPKRRAAGGGISGSDTVPALLTPGEFVVNKKAAQNIGYGNLNRMNKQGVTGFAKGGTVGIQRFQAGGGVLGGGSFASTAIAFSATLAIAQTALANFGDKTEKATLGQVKYTIIAERVINSLTLLAGIFFLVIKPINDWGKRFAKGEKEIADFTDNVQKASSTISKASDATEQSTKRRKSKKTKTPQDASTGATVTTAAQRVESARVRAEKAKKKSQDRLSELAKPTKDFQTARTELRFRRNAGNKAIDEAKSNIAARDAAQQKAQKAAFTKDAARKRADQAQSKVDERQRQVNIAAQDKARKKQAAIIARNNVTRAEEKVQRKVKQKNEEFKKFKIVDTKQAFEEDKKALDAARAKKAELEKETGGRKQGRRKGRIDEQEAKIQKLTKKMEVRRRNTQAVRGALGGLEQAKKTQGVADQDAKRSADVLIQKQQKLAQAQTDLGKASTVSVKATEANSQAQQQFLNAQKRSSDSITKAKKAIESHRQAITKGIAAQANYSQAMKASIAAANKAAIAEKRLARERRAAAFRQGVGAAARIGGGVLGGVAAVGAIGNQIVGGLAEFAEKKRDRAIQADNIGGAVLEAGNASRLSGIAEMFTLQGFLESTFDPRGFEARQFAQQQQAEFQTAAGFIEPRSQAALEKITKGDAGSDQAISSVTDAFDEARKQAQDLATPAERQKAIAQLDAQSREFIKSMDASGASIDQLRATALSLSGGNDKLRESLLKQVEVIEKNRIAQEQLNKANFDALKITSAFGAAADAASRLALGLETGTSSLEIYALELESAAGKLGVDATKAIDAAEKELLASLGPNADAATVSAIQGQAEAARLTNQFGVAAGAELKDLKIAPGEEGRQQIEEALVASIPDDADPATRAKLEALISKNIAAVEGDPREIDLSALTKKILEEGNQLGAGFLEAVKIQAQHNKNMSALYQKREVLEQKAAEAANQAIETQLEAAKLFEEFGGARLTEQQELGARIAQFNNIGGLGGLGAQLTTGNASDIRAVATQIGTTLADQTDQLIGSALGTAVGTQTGAGAFGGAGGFAADKRPEAEAANKALIQFTKQRIALLKEELSIVEKKNAAEKSALESLISGDIEGFLDKQAAAGAGAALATGNASLAGLFSASALGAGFQTLEGQGLSDQQLRQAESLTLQRFGIQSTGVLSNTTAEAEAIKAQGRELSGVLGELSQQEAAFAQAEISVNNATITASQLAFDRALAETTARTNVQTNQLARGGIVYANRGMFVPRGTDTVPAMLTPGEFVVNRAAVQRGNNLQILKAINSGAAGAGASAPGAMRGGGQVNYYNLGGMVDSISNVFGMALPQLTTAFNTFSSAVDKLIGFKFNVTLDPTNINVNFNGTSFLSSLKEDIRNSVLEIVSAEIPKYKSNSSGDLSKKTGVV